MRKIAFVVAVISFLLTGKSVWAEPYLAAWKGVNCNACHVNETGGWLRNDFGKNYGNSLQTFDWQGLSDVGQKISHNTPSFVLAGLDIHENYTATLQSNSNFNQNSFYMYGPLNTPMVHSDFSIQVKANEVVSGVYTYRIDQGAVGEFYGLVSSLPEGAYFKFGRLLTPYGLELSDDYSLVRMALKSVFGFDAGSIQNGVETGIYPDPFFANVALFNGTSNAGSVTVPGYNEKTVSAKGGFHFSQITLGGSIYGQDLDLNTRQLLYGAFGWGRIGPAVILAEYDSGYDGVSVAVLPGPMTSQTNYQAYHVSAEFDLGNSVYLRLANEWLNDSLGQNTNDGYRDVVTVRCYPVRNLKFQLDVARYDPFVAVNDPNYSVMADAFMFY